MMMEDWPAADLEPAGRCPVCSCDDAAVLHENALDVVYRVPGRWRITQCAGCGLGHLDPRPSQSALPRVYTGYHTRGPSDGEGSFRADVAKAVAARSFGYRLHATAWRIRAAAAFAGLVPALRRKAQPAFPPIRAWKPPPYRVLDVGCGNGGFLEAMRRIGWTVEGQEWDARAAEAARARGLTVHTEPLERLDVRADLVTMHHVLEHVPDPVTFLDAARRLLEPGGFVYVTTPNLASRGHSIYGKAWRGLEPPRHLHLFTNDSLERTARAAGYVRAEVMPRPDEDRLILESSQRLAKLISSPPTTQPRSAGASEHEVIALVAQNPVG